MAAGSTILKAEQLTRRVDDGERTFAIVDDVSLELASGETVALLGPSGSGKSTLLHILGALDTDYEGTVTFEGTRLGALTDRGRALFRNQSLGFVFQAFNLLGHLDALDNVLLPARFGDAAPSQERARELLAQVGLADKAHRRPETLSGGERQRVAIARALYHQPKLVLCDEPTGNLDRQTGSELLRLFADLSAKGVAFLVASHDEAVAAAAHRTLAIDRGRLQ